MKNLRSMIGRTAFAAAVSAVSLFGGACAANHPDAAPAAPKKTVKASLYVDSGSGGNGMLYWARLLEYSPEIELALISGKEIREGKLKGQDLVVFPGGYAPRQYESLQEEGAAAVRKFVADGGSYLGICAGFASSLNAPKRIRLLPFGRKPRSGGKYGVLAVDVSARGSQVLDIRPGRYKVRYNGGPIPCPGDKPGEGWGEGLAVYGNTVSYFDKPEGNFYGDFAILHGQFGKGKVIAISFHPESFESTHCIALGAVYAVTGVKPKPVFPKNDFRPLRVGFYILGTCNSAIRQMFALDREPKIGLRLTAADELNEGALSHVDALFISDGPAEKGKVFQIDPVRSEQIRVFLERGGLIFAPEAVCQYLPKHPNVKPYTGGPDPAEQVLKQSGM